MKRRAGRWAVAAVMAALGSVAFYVWAQTGPDADGDGWSDAFETAFGTDAAAPDTDRDGWADSVDSNALSRAVIRWGDPDFTTGDDYMYPGPAWWLGGAKLGGQWLSNPPAFHVGACETGSPSLFIFLDRATLTGDVRLATAFLDHPGGSLLVDLLDSNSVGVATDLYGNIMTGSGAVLESIVNVPLAVHPDAVAVQLRRAAGEVTVYTNRLYVDVDGDGLDADQEAQLGTSDTAEDSDADGYGDGEEVLLFHTDALSAFSAPGRCAAVGAGEDFSLFAAPSGQTWAWGLGGQGQLGIGSSVSWTSVSTHVTGPAGFGDIGAVDGGWNFGVSLKADGTVWAWGANGNGRLGDNTTAERDAPVPVHGIGNIGFLSNAMSIAAGEAHGLAVLADGTVAAWGDNGSGQLGDNTTTTRKTPVSVCGPGGVGLLSNVVAVAAGRNFSLALAGDGALWAWGANGQGQLGDGSSTTRKTPVRVRGAAAGSYLSHVIAFAAGHTHGLAACADGSAWAWGDNGDGKLGDNTTINRIVPVRVHGENDAGFIPGVAAVAAGQFHSLALGHDGKVWAWGQNNQGRLGDNTTTSRKTPVRVHGQGNVGYLANIAAVVAGQRHNIALDRDGVVWTWGNNEKGQLGDGTITNRYTPVPVDTDADGLPDAWELAHFFNLDQNATDDPDSDGLTNLREYQFGTDPRVEDSDGDWIDDGAEVAAGTDPRNPSSHPVFPVTVSGTVTYAGLRHGTLRVIAATKADGWGGPAVALTVPGPYSIANVQAPGAYWLKAYLDSNGNGSNDTWEACGSLLSNPLRLAADAVHADFALVDPDSDGDGLVDYLELLYGADPFVSNHYGRLPFVELFEPNLLNVGDIDGQHGWRSSTSQGAFVQSDAVYGGLQALGFAGPADAPVAVDQLIAGPVSPVVWLDVHMRVEGAAAPTGTAHEAVCFYFSHQGRLVVRDGLRAPGAQCVELTNAAALPRGSWERVSVRADYGTQTWLACLNGVKVAEGLGFALPIARLGGIEVEGAHGAVDDVIVSAEQPPGLSLDGDSLPDEWESQRFGNLDHRDDTDGDGDGASDLAELRADTDPNMADTDGDGIPDGWEIAHGLDPLTADAGADPDGDGLSNLREYQLGTAPLVADTDGDGLADNVEVDASHTDPLRADSDGDGYGDGVERARGFDPLDAASRPMRDWPHAMALTVRPCEGFEGLDDVPVPVRLNPGRVDYAQFAPDGADLRFTDAACLPLDFEIDEWDSAGESIVWVRLPALGTSNAPARILMFWGNPAASGAANPAGVWRGYAGVWHFGQGGNVLADSAPGGHDAVNGGSVAAVGLLGKCRNFRGSDNVLLPPAAFAGVGEAVTISLWQYGAATQPRENTLFEGVSAVGRELGILLPWSDGKVYWDAFGEADRLYKAAETNEYKGAWNHWTFTKDQAAGAMTICLNGEPWASATNKVLAYTPITALGLGSAANGTGRYMGFLDEVRIETVARSAAWNRFQYLAMRDEALIYGQQVVSIAGTRDGAEPAHACEFTVTRSGGDLALPLTVNLALGESSASVGLDFAEPPHAVVIPVGAVQASFAVDVLEDYRIEETESIVMSLAAGDYVIDPAHASASIAIADDDLDTDGDGLCDAWEWLYFGGLQAGPSDDPDGDGLSNRAEHLRGTNPTSADSDGDGMPDGWEVANGLDPLHDDAAGDLDGDGLPNLDEYRHGTNPQTADFDGDGMADGWEIAHGLNPTDPDDGALDPDGDGLTNVREYEAGTDPHNPDTDGDGLTDGLEVNTLRSSPLKIDTDGDTLPDAWEVAHGFDPRDPFDGSRDADGDGLSNASEYRLGTDLFNADTDSDGVRDGEEVMEALTDPLHAEFDGVASDVCVVNGADAVARLGGWTTRARSLVSQGRRGSVEYSVQCAVADIYRIALDATHLWNASTCDSPLRPVSTSDLLIYIDGRYLGKTTLVAADGAPGTVRIFTPWLQPGAHVVRVFWDNVHRNLSLRLDAVRLQSLGGPDTDHDGVKDWVETSVAAQTSLDRVHAAVYVGGSVSNTAWGAGWTNGSTSVVSPVCIEGVDRYPDLMSIVVDGVTNLPAQPGSCERWYADVSLSMTGNTAIAVSYQSGAIERRANVRWVPLNVLAAGDIRVRVGDALMFTAHPVGAITGTVAIAVGDQTYATTVDTPVVHTFDTPGSYQIAGTYEGAESGSIHVTVVGTAFPQAAPACLLGRARSWICPGLPEEAEIEADPTVALARSGPVLGITMSKVNRDHYLVARLGSVGPVLARTRLQGFWIQAAVDSYLSVVERTPDSAVWQQELVAKALPPDVDVHAQVFVAGVTFDDLSLERWITSADLNELGEYSFRLIRPNSVRTATCHYIEAFQGGMSVGEAYYSGVLFPNE